MLVINPRCRYVNPVLRINLSCWMTPVTPLLLKELLRILTVKISTETETVQEEMISHTHSILSKNMIPVSASPTVPARAIHPVHARVIHLVHVRVIHHAQFNVMHVLVCIWLVRQTFNQADNRRIIPYKQ